MKIVKVKDIPNLSSLLDGIDFYDNQINEAKIKRDKLTTEIHDLLVKLEGQPILDCEYNKTTKEIRYVTESCLAVDEFKFSKPSRKAKKH